MSEIHVLFYNSNPGVWFAHEVLYFPLSPSMPPAPSFGSLRFVPEFGVCAECCGATQEGNKSRKMLGVALDFLLDYHPFGLPSEIVLKKSLPLLNARGGKKAINIFRFSVDDHKKSMAYRRRRRRRRRRFVFRSCRTLRSHLQPHFYCRDLPAVHAVTNFDGAIMITLNAI